MRQNIKSLIFIIVLGLSIMLGTYNAYAQQTCSGSYCTNEYFFGTGGDVDLNSNSYRARGAAGALGVGSTSSSNYDGTTGTISGDKPYLEMQVTGADINFGVLSESTTSSQASQGGDCSCSFYVRSYLSSGYIVVTMSQPPTTEGGAVLDAKTSLGVPSTDQNTEEFGINLVDNSSPNIGANPANIPDDTFADGEAATGYSSLV